jgi:putative ABC transport system ATP-binding protein
MLPLELQGQSNVAQQAEHYLRRVELDARMGHYPLQLSGGEQQRVALARAFASRPAILFADEPTGNLDTRTGERIIDLVFELNREEGTTLVLVTHDLALADRCQRRLRLDGGALVKE